MSLKKNEGGKESWPAFWAEIIIKYLRTVFVNYKFAEKEDKSCFHGIFVRQSMPIC